MNSNLDPSPRRLSAAEKEFEKAIRPADFHNFYGQAKVIENIIVFVQAARARGEAATGRIWGEDPTCYLTDEECSP